jgi:hypothetical protein
MLLRMVSENKAIVYVDRVKVYVLHDRKSEVITKYYPNHL